MAQWVDVYLLIFQVVLERLMFIHLRLHSVQVRPDRATGLNYILGFGEPVGEFLQLELL